MLALTAPVSTTAIPADTEVTVPTAAPVLSVTDVPGETCAAAALVAAVPLSAAAAPEELPGWPAGAVWAIAGTEMVADRAAVAKNTIRKVTISPPRFALILPVDARTVRRFRHLRLAAPIAGRYDPPTVAPRT